MVGVWGFFGGLDILGVAVSDCFLRHGMKLLPSVHQVYQCTFSTTELLRVDNQVANGCSAAAEFTGPLAGLCVCCTECPQLLGQHILNPSLKWGLTQVSAISRKTFITLASPVRFCRRKKMYGPEFK